MISSENQEWIPCAHPEIGDTLKWNEPLWAPPNKPRGKRDKIGEQEVIAGLISKRDVLEFRVISVARISVGDIKLTVRGGDVIKRKLASIQKGDCQKLPNE